MTIACLLANTVTAAYRCAGIEAPTWSTLGAGLRVRECL